MERGRCSLAKHWGPDAALPPFQRADGLASAVAVQIFEKP